MWQVSGPQDNLAQLDLGEATPWMVQCQPMVESRLLARVLGILGKKASADQPPVNEDQQDSLSEKGDDGRNTRIGDSLSDKGDDGRNTEIGFAQGVNAGVLDPPSARQSRLAEVVSQLRLVAVFLDSITADGS